MGIRLNQEQFIRLQSAILDAYTTEVQLEQVLRFHLDTNLNAVAGGDNLSEITFQLVIWAERSGHLADLLDALREGNPGNSNLAQTVDAIKDELRLAESHQTSATTPAFNRVVLPKRRLRKKWLARIAGAIVCILLVALADTEVVWDGPASKPPIIVPSPPTGGNTDVQTPEVIAMSQTTAMPQDHHAERIRGFKNESSLRYPEDKMVSKRNQVTVIAQSDENDWHVLDNALWVASHLAENAAPSVYATVAPTALLTSTVTFSLEQTPDRKCAESRRVTWSSFEANSEKSFSCQLATV